VNDKKLSSLELLEQDIWLNFCYYYQCELNDESIASENQSCIDKKEKIIKRMQQNDFAVSELMAFRQEMVGETIPFKPSQLAELLTHLNTLKVEMNNLPAKIFQRQYSDVLIAYVQMLGGLEFIKNNTLAKSAKAIIAVKARYAKHLYPRREIIYRILREQVAHHGKWKNLNQAVNFILNDLLKAFEVYDIQWLKEELAEKQKMLGSLEQEWQSAKQASVDSRSVRRKPASIIKKIEKLKLELKSINQILKSKYPSREMEKFGYKMPYSDGYIAETIIHELRIQPEILQEILLKENC
jgi:molecular chaperone GrpE (heat shock protein)